MSIRKHTGLLCAAASLAFAGAAQADTTWTVSGIFDDGTTLSGTFLLDVYGVLRGADLVTTAAGAFPGTTYYGPGPTTSTNSGLTFVDLQPGPYTSDLHLDFADDISGPNAVGGTTLLISSYECINSYSCYLPAVGPTRYIGSGTASVPEPVSWALMVGGFGLVGAALRSQRTRLRFA